MKVFLDKITSIIKRTTLFDRVFILIFFILLGAFVFFLRREIRYITATFKVTDKDVLYAVNNPGEEFAHNFIVGDTERNEIGQIVSEIIGVDSYRIKPGKQVVYLDIRLKTVYSFRKNQHTIKGRPIIFGQPFTFRFSNVSFQALVTNFPGLKEKIGLKEGRVVVKAQLREESREFSDVYGVPDYIAQAIKVGDQVVDSKGDILAKVLQVEVRPAKRMVVTDSGRSFVINDHQLKDVFCTIELKTKEVDEKRYMFDFIPVLIGQHIPLNLPNISQWLVITEIIE